MFETEKEALEWGEENAIGWFEVIKTANGKFEVVEL